MQTEGNTHVNYRNAKPNANRADRRKKSKKFHFLALAFTLAFTSHTCEPGQRERKMQMQGKHHHSFHTTTVDVKTKLAGFIRRETGRKRREVSCTVRGKLRRFQR